MFTIYRIEDPVTRLGMYHADNGMDASSTDNGRHPAPEHDSLLLSVIEDKTGEYACDVIDRREYSYGFGSVEQLRSWLYKDEWLDKLDKNGFVLAVYVTDRAFVGNTQAMFIRSEIPHGTFKLTEYFNTEGVNVDGR